MLSEDILDLSNMNEIRYLNVFFIGNKSPTINNGYILTFNRIIFHYFIFNNLSI